MTIKERVVFKETKDLREYMFRVVFDNQVEGREEVYESALANTWEGGGTLFLGGYCCIFEYIGDSTYDITHVYPDKEEEPYELDF